MSMLNPPPDPTTTPAPAPAPVRYAEKRRTSTCRFADRIAQFSLDHYREHIPGSFRETQKQTCLAAIVALVKPEGSAKGNANNGNEENIDRDITSDTSHNNSQLYMLGMGVGTKFLSSDVLNIEMGFESHPETSRNTSIGYGKRVRDCHAEVLARRAFRRQLSLEMLQALQLSNNKDTITKPEPFCILQRIINTNGSVKFALRPGVSLHMYASSAPCGNATLKKFATMKQERFRDNLGMDEWPADVHDPIIGHSVNLGQFALLVKRDPGRASSAAAANGQLRRDMNTVGASNKNGTQSPIAKKRKAPAMQSTDWCPPGTSTVWANEGSIHTCSDKLCRWNCLGLQGSLLASLLEQPLFMSSLTVGRKLTECICRRAVCCRAAAAGTKKKKKRNRVEETCQNASATDGSDQIEAQHRSYKINHPAIMGTQVYMDETGVIDMSRNHEPKNGETAIEGQDVRFHNSLSWAWWPSITLGEYCTKQLQLSFECIDGASGLAVAFEDTKTLCSPEHRGEASRVSTLSLLDLHVRIQKLLGLTSESGTANTENDNSQKQPSLHGAQNLPMTLKDLRAYKKRTSPEYEAEKHELLTKHPVFRQWKRRREEPVS